MRILTTTLVLGLLLAGCATNDQPAEGAAAPEAMAPPMVPQQLNTVAMLDPGLSNKLEVTVADAHRTDAGTYRVHAVFKNRTSREIDIQVRTQFFDEMRHPLQPPTRWEVLHVPPRAIETVTQSSSTQAAANFYVEVLPL